LRMSRKIFVGQVKDVLNRKFTQIFHNFTPM
jgi:hypothetical protein